MDSSYFLSRTELLSWMNSVLPPEVCTSLQLRKVEQCSSGIPYAVILAQLYPQHRVSITNRLKTPARTEYDSRQNLKLVQDTLTRLGVRHTMDIDRMAKGNYQSALEFLQWFKKFCDDSGGLIPRSEEEQDIVTQEHLEKALGAAEGTTTTGAAVRTTSLGVTSAAPPATASRSPRHSLGADHPAERRTPSSAHSPSVRQRSSSPRSATAPGTAPANPTGFRQGPPSARTAVTTPASARSSEVGGGGGPSSSGPASSTRGVGAGITPRTASEAVTPTRGSSSCSTPTAAHRAAALAPQARRVDRQEPEPVQTPADGTAPSDGGKMEALAADRAFFYDKLRLIEAEVSRTPPADGMVLAQRIRAILTSADNLV